MLSSLQSGASGLSAHQTYLDVIGNNLANTNTTGFKSSRITFSDLFSNTLRNASRPTSSMGGKNAQQVGTGVLVGSIDMLMAQGPVLNTGRPFDLGIQGNGFFVLSDGTQTYFSRAGAFGIDGDQYLVDLATGMRVQTTTMQDIQIDTTQTIPPTATSEVELVGSLPALITGPLAEVVTSTAVLLEGTPAELTSSAAGNYSLADGDSMSIRVNGNAAQDVDFDATDFNTVTGGDLTNCTAAEMAQYINSLGLTGIIAEDYLGTNTLRLYTENTGLSATIDIDNENGTTPANKLGLSLSMVSGTQDTADENSTLNELTVNKGDYQDGDLISISGIDYTGLAVHADFVYGAANDGTTFGDLRDFISNSFAEATCTIDSDGHLVLTADDTGAVSMSLIIDDDENANGLTLWPSFAVSTEGADEDTMTTSVSYFDSQGLTNTLVLTFTRSTALRWDVTAAIPDNPALNVTSNIGSVEFNPNGSFNAILGNSNTITVYNPDINSTQNITIDFGAQSGFDGLTQVGDEGSITVGSQNGFGPGQLATLSVNTEGQILGSYTNGQFLELGQLGLATFTNAEGLEKYGDSMYIVTPNSSTPIYNTPGNQDAGIIISGALEQSNVDIGKEFVSLIEAQRGFQANAKVVTTADEVLRDMVNLV
ncbi:MAG: flagellar hook protein FlgE [Planctomycetota bacterium]|jgi:flagellar hook protein FlgE